MRRAAFAILHATVVVLLTIITQVGGAAYLLGLSLSRRFGRLSGWAGALLIYGSATLVVLPASAPFWGRVALPCGPGSTELYAPQSLLYCALNRHYVTPRTRDAVADIARQIAKAFPGTRVTYLDAGFPLPLGLPLLPHLSHRHGRSVDLSLFYEGRPDAGAWPLGYFAFSPAARYVPPVCAEPGPMRWSLGWLQPAFAGISLDRRRTAALVGAAVEHPDIDRIYLHPALKSSLGLENSKVRFAGCHAARHDDHVHLDVR